MAQEKKLLATHDVDFGEGKVLTVETFACVGVKGHTIRQTMKDAAGNVAFRSCSCTCWESGRSDSCYCKDSQDCGCDCSNPERPRAYCR